jgi:hypothetical protein
LPASDWEGTLDTDLSMWKGHMPEQVVRKLQQAIGCWAMPRTSVNADFQQMYTGGVTSSVG